MTVELCPVCQLDGTTVEGTSQIDCKAVACKRCGKFSLTEEAQIAILNRPGLEAWRLSGAIREKFERSGKPQQVQSNNIDVFLAGAPERFDVAVKARKLLSIIARRTTEPGTAAEPYFHPKHDCSLAFAASDLEFRYILNYLQDLGWIKLVLGNGDKATLTPTGWEQVRLRPRIDSAQGFVAMAFAEIMKATYIEAIYPAVRNDCGFECKRIDAKEYNGAIIDEIKGEIRQSRFLIADVTLHRNGVYFEAGFADGLDVPVIWTCDDKDADKTHLDAKHINQIRWTSHDDLRTRLKHRILGTIGCGPLAPKESKIKA